MIVSNLIIFGFLAGILKAIHTSVYIKQNATEIAKNQKKFHRKEMIIRTTISLLGGIIFSLHGEPWGWSFIVNTSIIFSALHLIFDPFLNILHNKVWLYASVDSNTIDANFFSKRPILWFIAEIIFLLILVWIKLHI